MNEIQEWLRRGVLDLSIMLRGIDLDLDTALEELKVTLKDRKTMDVAAFKAALERTDRRFDQIEAIGETGITQLYQLYGSLVQLDPATAPEPFKNQVEAAHRYLYDALQLLGDAIQLVPDERPACHNDDDDTLKRLRQKLCSRFITLLRTLAILGDQDGALKSLAHRLEPIPDWSTLDSLAAETISLIQRRLDAEKGQFEYYLNQLNEKLRTINELITEDHQSVGDLSRLNDRLDERVDEQLNHARREIENAADLEQLRHSLNLSLDGLLTMLNDFQQQSRDSLSAMSQRQADLNEQLQSLREDNLQLIKQVTHEREMSMRDPLTQLPNRQGFEARLKEEMARANRYKQPVSVALIDVDHFKRINDQFGHLAGDKVLRILAKEMSDQLRESDYLARFGGEEFVLLLPQTEGENALAALEKMRRHISECPFNFHGEPVQITFCAGVAEYNGEETSDPWLHRADQALYRCKNEGRNRALLAGTVID